MGIEELKAVAQKLGRKRARVLDAEVVYVIAPAAFVRELESMPAWSACTGYPPFESTK